MKLVVHEFMTLDGVVQGPGSADEDRSGGFGNGGWMVPFGEQTGWGEAVNGWFESTTALLLGRKTHDDMYAYWSQITDPDNLVATVLNEAPKYIVSSTLTQSDWMNAQVIPGDWRQQVALLKKVGDGELQVHGSWQLATALHAAGLVDEYRLLIFPVTVGAGKRLFGTDAAPRGFEVARAEVLDGSVTSLRLRPTEFTQGSFAVQDGTEVLNGV